MGDKSRKGNLALKPFNDGNTLIFGKEHSEHVPPPLRSTTPSVDHFSNNFV
mgnify:CR=1 FL=1